MIQQSIISIKGMTCMGCVNSVKNVLKNLPGITAMDVTLEPAQATVQYDSATISLDRLKEAILDAGFEVAD
ncbi:heavy-metal-associated domain-containing protein [Nitrosomonas sp. JL21]|uniref:heavy-metal-associated domain-containing protein n=1 Tax=Nitrosomonas sp. JL21 TaxID=153949 RepID=UPI001F04B555|nr:heavy-metal-associated domain-containing protein [Nitrosomonas sp. JL21]